MSYVDRFVLLPYLTFRAKIDVINFLAPVAPRLSKRSLKAYGALGFPLHDPTREELAICAHFPLVRVEVALDVMPGKRVRRKVLSSAAVQDAFNSQVYQLMCGCLFPWGGPGISLDARGFRTTTRRRTSSRAQAGETLYFGHKWDRAQVKVYIKQYDQGKPLMRDDWSVRVELTLDRKGCEELGLKTVGDLLKANLRTTVGQYFRVVRLVPKLFSSKSKLYRYDKALFQRLRERLEQVNRASVESRFDEVGAHALIYYQDANLGRLATHAGMSRRIGLALSRALSS